MIKKLLLTILFTLVLNVSSYSQDRFLVFNKCYKKTYDTYGKLIEREDFYKKRTINQKLFEDLTDIVLRVDLQTNDVRIQQKSLNDFNPAIFFGNLMSINKNSLLAVSKGHKNRKIVYDFKQNTLIFVKNDIQDSKDNWWYCEPYSGSNNQNNSTLKSILKMLN
jgi:hypothetical protein